MSNVMRQMCSTCIFRPGNPMHLRPGRLEDMCRETDAKDTNVICHKSKGLMDEIPVEAFCRGSVDRRPGKLVRFMEWAGAKMNEVDDPAPLPPSP